MHKLNVCLFAALAFSATACDFEINDLNNPAAEDLEDNPTASLVTAAATGLLIGNRGNVAGAASGYVTQLGILGREAYNFDAADPRLVGELLEGELQKGSPFGGAFWIAPYANVRNCLTVIVAADQVADFSAEESSAIKGFARTIQALDLLRVITTRDDIGAIADTDLDVDVLGPIVGKDQVLAAIAGLLDTAATELENGGDAFVFNLSSGYDGFDTPATFRTFNRAIRARVAIYQEDPATALTALGESFLDITASLDLGVFHFYSTGAGDTVNTLINPNIFAHLSLVDDAQMKADTNPDDRLTSKTVVVPEGEEGGAQGLESDRRFTMYVDGNSFVPIIRNEELILLRAEANIMMDDLTAAQPDIDLIRTTSGGLDALTLTADNAEDELLYNRRYSLMFEGGHRWIDLRRYDRIGDLPLDQPQHIRNFRFPIQLDECNARGVDGAGNFTEARCNMGTN